MQPDQKPVDTGFLTMPYHSVFIGIYQSTPEFVVEGRVSARFLHINIIGKVWVVQWDNRTTNRP